MKTTEKKGELWCRRRHDVVHTHGPTNIYTRNVPTVFWVTVLKNTVQVPGTLASKNVVLFICYSYRYCYLNRKNFFLYGYMTIYTLRYSAVTTCTTLLNNNFNQTILAAIDLEFPLLSVPLPKQLRHFDRQELDTMQSV